MALLSGDLPALSARARAGAGLSTESRHSDTPINGGLNVNHAFKFISLAEINLRGTNTDTLFEKKENNVCGVLRVFANPKAKL